MSQVIYEHHRLTVEAVERSGRIGARRPTFIRLKTDTGEEVDLEHEDVEALVAALDVWLEDQRP